MLIKNLKRNITPILWQNYITHLYWSYRNMELKLFILTVVQRLSNTFHCAYSKPLYDTA